MIGLVNDRTLCQLSTSTSGLAQDCGATSANNDALSVAEDRCDLVATGALHVHEIRIGMLHQALELVLPLLLSGQRVQ